MSAQTLSDWVSHSGVKFGSSGARGLVSKMTDAVCFAYTSVFIQSVTTEAERVVIWHDLRPSSPAKTAACPKAIIDADKEVIYVLALPAAAVAYYELSLGVPSIIVTGSQSLLTATAASSTGPMAKSSTYGPLAMRLSYGAMPSPLHKTLLNSCVLPVSPKFIPYPIQSNVYS